jgi:hypothetical protein
MAGSIVLLKGVIEGFYGRQWSWDARRAWAQLLARDGAKGCYVYAPKAQQYLADNWRSAWPADEWSELADLGRYYIEQGARFGVGLSPRKISLNKEDLDTLRHKIKELLTLKPAILCLLFDDSEAISDTAKSQSILVEICLEILDGHTQLLFCPTWYGLDPRLRELYGDPPERYYEDLGEYLPKNAGILWTGEKTCSMQHSSAHWQAMGELLQRKPVLWDNSKANDGSKICAHLRLCPFAPEWQQLKEWSSGILLNPMNQSCVAQFMYAHLMDCLDGTHTDKAQSEEHMEKLWEQALMCLQPEGLKKAVQADRQLFSEEGIANMDNDSRQAKTHHYRAFNTPVANEIADWLSGAYTFDPECLT